MDMSATLASASCASSISWHKVNVSMAAAALWQFVPAQARSHSRHEVEFEPLRNHDNSGGRGD